MSDVNQESTALPDVNYLVVGLGLSGYSSARFLLRRGHRCRVQDTREQPPYIEQLRAEFDALEFHSGELDADMTAWADVLVVSPGVSVRQDEIRRAADNGKTVLGDIELFARLVDKPVVAITGSNGKSTVTTLVGEMIRCDQRPVAVGGNLGTAALDLLEQQEVEFYVLELSSYQLETTTSLRPRVAALLNLCEDHLDRYESYAAYVEAKLRVYDNADICVSNLDDEQTRHDAHDVCFSLDPNSSAEFRLVEDGAYWLAHRDEPWLPVDRLGISGRHNWANALAAMAIAHRLDISRDAIVSALQDFRGIPHRSQWVAEVDGVEWINDSKATNVGAAQASIEGRVRPVILIAGGQSKGADMSVMAETIRQKVKRVLLLGEDAERLQQAWQDATEIERVDNMRTAVQRAGQVAEHGDCVLLAPACASFDMYPHFEARGDDFMQCVQELVDAG
jgi:UDP-N-acetylmuramoylalanine--D-glutamate ligase